MKKYLLLIGLAALALVALYQWFQPQGETALTTATSASSARLEILDARYATQSSIKSLKPWLTKFLARTGSSQWSFGLSKLRTEITNDRFSSATYETDTAHLILVARGFDPHGNVIQEDSVDMPWERYDKKNQLERNDEGIFLRTERNTGPLPKMQMEVEDGHGGWIVLNGPLIPHARDGRGFFSTPFFLRTTPTLQVRVTLPNDSPVTVNIPNPDYQTNLPAWEADPKPWRKDLGDVAISATWRKPPRSAPAMVYNFNTHSQSNNQPDEAWRITTLSVKDRMGNARTHTMDYPLVMRPKLLRHTFAIDRSEHYRWPMNEVTVLGDLVWKSDNKTMEASLSKEAIEMGMTTLQLTPRPEKLVGNHEPLHEWAITMTGTAPPAHAVSEYWKQNLTLILNSEEQSSGMTLMGIDGSWSNSTSSVSYETTSRWGGLILDGQRVQIVLPQLQAAKQCEFTLPIQSPANHGQQREAPLKLRLKDLGP